MIPHERYKDRPFIEAVAIYARRMVKAGFPVHEIAKRTREVKQATIEEVMKLTKEIECTVRSKSV